MSTSLLDYFRGRQKKGTAAVAKERLQILVAHERAARNRPSYLRQMQEELLQVVRKYVHVDDDTITVALEQEGNQEILELNIILPDQQE